MYGIAIIDREKEELTQKLSEQYSQNIINVEEYERVLEYINRIETKKEINIIRQIIQGNGNENNELSITENETAVMQKTKEKHLSTDLWSMDHWSTDLWSMDHWSTDHWSTDHWSTDHWSTDHWSAFSWRTTNVKSINGSGGKFTSLFGANRIIVDNLPKGRTILNVNSIFGLTEIIVPKNTKVTNKAVPVFSGIFGPDDTNRENKDLPELYITGKAVFGNITIIVK